MSGQFLASAQTIGQVRRAPEKAIERWIVTPAEEVGKIRIFGQFNLIDIDWGADVRWRTARTT